MTGFDPLTAATILYLTAKGAGERRDLNLITQTCAFLGADIRVVQMAFGFAEDRRDGEVRDYLLNADVLPKIGSAEQADAYQLAMQAAGVAVGRRTMVDRIVAKIRRNRAAVKGDNDGRHD